jgi:1-acyl-sn-glycerol-3-phosphate acyltransferase
VARAVVGQTCRLVLRLRILDAECIPTGGSALLAANHVSVLDGPALSLPPLLRGRPIRFLVAAEMFRSAAGPILRAYDQIPIMRNAGDVGALDEAIATIRSGALAGIFPEGRVHPGDARSLQRVRTGAARIALAAGAPIVPAGIWGTNARWPKSGLRLTTPSRPAATIAFGPAIEPRGDASSMQDVQAFTERIAKAISTQRDRAREDAVQRDGVRARKPR